MTTQRRSAAVPAVLLALVLGASLLVVPAARAEEPGTTPAAGPEAEATSGITAQAAFELLAGMAGTWHGPATIKGGEGLWATHEIRPVVNGDVVMETMTPASGHEMINMYHLDGEDLVLAHYCSGGHHPKMKLNLERSHAGELIFDFVSGSNFDPAVDKHIHDARITIIDDDQIASTWTAYDKGVKQYEATFDLARGAD